MKSFKRKYLRMQILYKNKDSGSKDQNKKEFHFISSARQSGVNLIFFRGEMKFHFGSHVTTL